MESDKITVNDLIEGIKGYFSLKLIAGKKGLKREIGKKYISRPGYILAGYDKDFPADAVQIIGNRDIGYLATLSDDVLQERIDRFTSFQSPLIVITCNYKAPKILVKGCNDLNIPLVKTEATSSQISEVIHFYLEEKMAEFVYLHGNLVDVFGIGLLITGESGMGKSELALDLITKGHRLVADDIVCVKRKRDVLVGEEKEKENILMHNIEIRGVGILNAAALFGIKAVRIQKRLEMQLELVKWEKTKDYTRTGLETGETEILGVPIPKISVPLIPGKNITTIAEVVAMDYLGKNVGFYSAEIFEHELVKKLKKKRKKYLRREEDEE